MGRALKSNVSLTNRLLMVGKTFVFGRLAVTESPIQGQVRQSGGRMPRIRSRSPAAFCLNASRG